jgi:opacity protein-like surface antigen
MKRRILLLASTALLLPALSQAQLRQGTVEISPFAGYLFGGEFSRGSNALFDFDVDADDEATWGGRIGFNLTSNFQLEVQASRTDTAFVSEEGGDLFGGSDQRFADLRIDYLLGYGTFSFGRRRVVPYVTIGAGVARLDPGPREDIVCVQPCRNPDAETRFTASLGVGLKTFVTPHFGFRFDARGYSTSLDENDDDDDFGCDDLFDDCNERRDWLTNGEITGGLIFAF